MSLNLAAMSSNQIMEWFKDLPFLTQMSLMKFGPLKSNEITSSVLLEAAKILGIKASAATTATAATLIQRDDPDSLADWLGKDDNVPKLMKTLLAPSTEVVAGDDGKVEEPESQVVVCPLCNGCYEQ